MRVAFYAPLKPPGHPVPSGDRRVARLLLAAIRRSGNDGFIASEMRSFEGVGDQRVQTRIRHRGEALAQRLIQKHRDNPPDIWLTYHLYHKAPDWIGPAVCDALSIPYVVAEASVAPKQKNGRWKMGFDATCTALQHAARVIVLNPVDRECVESVIDSPGRMINVPPFIDTRPPRRAAGNRDHLRQTLADRYDIPQADTWIAVAAMMRPGDKLESYRVLGRAMQQLSDLPLRWLIAGDGPARADVEAALSAGQTTYLGALDRKAMDALHAAADFAVWPAIREAFGMAMLEAQAAGLPVIAGRSPGVAQIVADGKTGLLTTVGDDRMLANAIRSLTGDPDRQRKMGLAAMHKAESEHDLAAAAVRIGQILQDARELAA